MALIWIFQINILLNTFFWPFGYHLWWSVCFLAILFILVVGRIELGFFLLTCRYCFILMHTQRENLKINKKTSRHTIGNMVYKMDYKNSLNISFSLLHILHYMTLQSSPIMGRVICSHTPVPLPLFLGSAM